MGDEYEFSPEEFAAQLGGTATKDFSGELTPEEFAAGLEDVMPGKPNTFRSGVGGLFGGVAGGIDAMEAIGSALSPGGGMLAGRSAPKENILTDLAANVRGAQQMVTPPEERGRGNMFTEGVPEAFGQMGPGIAAGLVNPALGAAVFGAQSGGPAYFEVVGAGGSPEEGMLALVGNAGLAQLERVGAGGAFTKALRKLGGSQLGAKAISNIAAHIAVGGTKEVGTETLEQIGHDLIHAGLTGEEVAVIDNALATIQSPTVWTVGALGAGAEAATSRQTSQNAPGAKQPTRMAAQRPTDPMAPGGAQAQPAPQPVAPAGLGLPSGEVPLLGEGGERGLVPADAQAVQPASTPIQTASAGIRGPSAEPTQGPTEDQAGTVPGPAPEAAPAGPPSRREAWLKAALQDPDVEDPAFSERNIRLLWRIDDAIAGATAGIPRGKTVGGNVKAKIYRALGITEPGSLDDTWTRLGVASRGVDTEVLQSSGTKKALAKAILTAKLEARGLDPDATMAGQAFTDAGKRAMAEEAASDAEGLIARISDTLTASDAEQTAPDPAGSEPVRAEEPVVAHAAEAPPAAPAAQPARARNKGTPWEMTKAEYLEAKAPGVEVGNPVARSTAEIEAKKRGPGFYAAKVSDAEESISFEGGRPRKKERWIVRKRGDPAQHEKDHREWVETALRSGKWVPPEVLADYPAQPAPAAEASKQEPAKPTPPTPAPEVKAEPTKVPAGYRYAGTHHGNRLAYNKNGSFIVVGEDGSNLGSWPIPSGDGLTGRLRKLSKDDGFEPAEDIAEFVAGERAKAKAESDKEAEAASTAERRRLASDVVRERIRERFHSAKAKWKKGSFSVRAGDGKQSVNGKVSADGLWGIRKVDRSKYDKEGPWEITHIPSGLRAGKGHNSEAAARAYAQRLSETGTDWTKKDPDLSKARDVARAVANSDAFAPTDAEIDAEVATQAKPKPGGVTEDAPIPETQAEKLEGEKPEKLYSGVPISTEDITADIYKAASALGGKSKPGDILGNRRTLGIFRKIKDYLEPHRRAKKARVGSRDGATDYVTSEELRQSASKGEMEKLAKELDKPIIRLMKAADIGLDETGVDADPGLDIYVLARHAKEGNLQVAKVQPSVVEAKKALDAAKKSKDQGKIDSARAAYDAELAKFASGDTLGIGMSNSEAARILKAVESGPKAQAYDELGRRHDRITKATRDLWRKYGLQESEVVDAMEATYKHYAPARTDLEGDHIPTGRTGVKGRESKRRTGRETLPDSPVAFAIMQRNQAVMRGQRNSVLNEWAQDIETNADFWKGVAKVTTGRKIKTVVDDAVREVVDPSYATDPNVVAFKRDGKQHFVEVDPKYSELAKALNNADRATTGGLMNVISKMGALTRRYAKLRTIWSPEFLLSNPMRDLGSGFFASHERGVKFAKAWAKNIPGAFKTLTVNKVKGEYAGPDGDLLRQYVESGAPISYLDFKTVEDVAKSIERELSSWKPSAARKIGDQFRGVLGLLEASSEVIENATRFAAFKAAVQQGMDVKQAAIIAKNLTVNFESKGEWGAMMNAAYAFSTAAIGGTARTARLLNNRTARRAVVAATAAMVVWDQIAREMMGEDEDGEDRWDKISPGIKARHLVIPRFWDDPTREDPLKWALPPGISWIFYAGTELGALAAGERDPGDVVANVATQAIDAFNPLGTSASPLSAVTPTVLKPGVEIETNKDFSGRPIMPDYGDGPDAYKFWPDVSPLAKRLAQALNSATGGDEFESGKIDVSPETIEHMTEQVFGGLGTFALKTLKTGESLSKGEPVDENNVPIVSRFVVRPNPWASHKEFKSELKHLEAQKERKAITPDERRALNAGKAAEKRVSILKKKLDAAEAEGDTQAAREIEEQMDSVRQQYLKQHKRKTHQ